MKRILFILICLSFVGCTSTFKASNGEDGKPGTEQKGADGEDGKNGKNKSTTVGIKA